jgi:hypothetical protein
LFLRCRGGGIGRRTGLKIPRWKQRAGSIPAPGTSDYSLLQIDIKAAYLKRLRLFLFLRCEKQNRHKNRHIDTDNFSVQKYCHSIKTWA